MAPPSGSNSPQESRCQRQSTQPSCWLIVARVHSASWTKGMQFTSQRPTNQMPTVMSPFAHQPSTGMRPRHPLHKSWDFESNPWACENQQHGCYKKGRKNIPDEHVQRPVQQKYRQTHLQPTNQRMQFPLRQPIAIPRNQIRNILGRLFSPPICNLRRNSQHSQTSFSPPACNLRDSSSEPNMYIFA